MKRKPGRPKGSKSKTSGAATRRKLVPGTKLTEIQTEFLRHIVETGGKVRVSAQLAEIGETTHYAWYWHQPHYAEAYHAATTKARKVREDVVRAAVREAWELGWDEETIEQKLEQRPDPREPNGPPVMVPVEVKRKTSKRRFPMALIYEANSLFGNPARLEVNTSGPTQINIGSLRDLIDRAENMLEAESEVDE